MGTRVAARRGVGANTTKFDPEQILQWDIPPGQALLVGRKLRCPACEHQADVLDYTPLEHSVKYAAQVIPPLMCRACKHIFALRP